MSNKLVITLLLVSACGSSQHVVPAEPAPSGATAEPTAPAEPTTPAAPEPMLRCNRGDEPSCRTKCDRGDADSCNLLGSMYGNGYAVRWSLPKAFELYQRACEGGSGAGCRNAAYAYLCDGDIDDDTCNRARGYSWLPPHPKDPRDPPALADRDPAKAAELLERAEVLLRTACDDRDADACAELGEMSHDESAATALFRRACEGGSARGCGHWAESHETGQGTMKDPAKALALRQKACDAGDASSCHSLGTRYVEDATKDLVKAAQFYGKGCEAGGSASCLLAGWLWQDGDEPLTKDLARAKELLERSCHLGNLSGCLAADKL